MERTTNARGMTAQTAFRAGRQLQAEATAQPRIDSATAAVYRFCSLKPAERNLVGQAPGQSLEDALAAYEAGQAAAALDEVRPDVTAAPAALAAAAVQTGPAPASRLPDAAAPGRAPATDTAPPATDTAPPAETYLVGKAAGQSLEDALAAYEAGQAAGAPDEVGPDVTAAPAALAAAAVQPGPAPAAGMPDAAAPGRVPAVGAAPPKKKGRRRGLGCLLLLLTVVIGILALFSAWYLVNRKPVTEFLPPILLERVPHHLFSIYGVNKPMGVAVTPSGDRIYVTESAAGGLVKVFDRTGNGIGEIRPPDDGLPHAPVYLAVSPQGDVYVTDRATGAIYIYDSAGTYLRSFTPTTPISTWQPLGIAFAPGGDLWVTDLSAPFHRLEVFGSDGTLKQTIGTEGSFDFPNSIAFDAAGNAYVSDSNNGRILIFDPAGVQLSSLNRGVGADLGLPRGMALDDAGRLYVADATAQALHLYRTDKSTDGRPQFVADLGIEGTGDGEFEYPNGVATDLRARIYVTDRENDRVQVWGY